MAKVQGKKAAAWKRVASKAAARVKSAAKAVKAKASPRKSAPATKPAAKKAPVKKTAPKKVAASAARKPAGKSKVARPARPVARAAKAVAKAPKKGVAKVVKAAKVVAKAAKKAVVKAAKPVVKAKPAAAPKVKPAPPAKVKAPAAPKPLPKAVPVAAAKPVKPVAAPAPPATAPVESEKKRGRRARTRIHSDGSPAAAWLSTEKPRPASFIPAPPRAEAPSAVAAPPASSDRLIRPDDVDHPAVRTVPIRIDVEQAAGRYQLIAQPLEVSVRAGEGIEWDFRYLGGADISVEEIVVEFEKPSPFSQNVFRTRKPGGARPHRQMSGGALPAAAGRRIEYVVRAMTPFKTELAHTRVFMNVTA